MKMDIYDYIAILTLEGNGIYGAEISNFGEVNPQGNSLEEGIYGREKDNEELSLAIYPIKYQSNLENGQFMITIRAYMPIIRKDISNKAIKDFYNKIAEKPSPLGVGMKGKVLIQKKLE